tara:strand:- start:1543 stop:2196 length:654 start_codon:yes stop_codon:yes gene_type:complete
MNKVNVSHDEVIVEILKELKKDSTRLNGKLIRSAKQIPPVLLQEDHETYMFCRRRVYAKKWSRQKVANAKLKEQGLLVKRFIKEENELHEPNSRKGSVYRKWSEQEIHTIESYAIDFGHDIGCRKAAKELKRSFSSCKCKLGKLLREKANESYLQQKFYAPTPIIPQDKPKPTEVAAPVTKDIQMVDVQGYKITIAYNNGSSFIFNMETQEVNIKLK